MLIRSGIFFVAGLILVLFPEKLMKLQDYFLSKIKVQQRDSKRTTIILGFIFFAIAAVLLVISFYKSP